MKNKDVNLELGHFYWKSQITYRAKYETSLVQTPNIPDHVQQTIETPLFERDDPNYTLPKASQSCREMQTTKTDPALKGQEQGLCHKNYKFVIITA